MNGYIKNNFFKLVSILLSSKELEEFISTNDMSYKYLNKFIYKHDICRIYDWAETECFDDFISFITERSIALQCEFDREYTRKMTESLLQAHSIKQKGDYLECLLTSCSTAIEKYNLSIVTLDNGDDNYKIFIIDRKDLINISAIEHLKFHKWLQCDDG